MASTSGSDVNENGPGTFSDALRAFEAQASKQPAEPAPGAYVAVAYALGWAVGDALTCTKYQVFDHLVKVPELDEPAAQWRLLVQRIRSRCGNLNNHLKSAKADLELNDALKATEKLLLKPPPGSKPPPGGDNEAVGATNEQAMELHTGILSVLWPVESSLAKSYELGNKMQQMCATPLAEAFTKVKLSELPTTVTASVKAYSTELHRLLTALASKLPANAAHATDNSLRLWSASLSVGGEEFPEDLLIQGRLWHDVLAGSVSGKEFLGPYDYVEAANSTTDKLSRAARRAAARFMVVLVVATLAGISLIIWGNGGAIGIGITTLLAALGLSWRVISDYSGRATTKGEEPLWNTEIEWAIAYRFTNLNHPPNPDMLKSRSTALDIDRQTKANLRRYMHMKQTWPDVLTS